MNWEYFGSGAYNHVYCNEEKTLIFKVQQSDLKGVEQLLDTPERSIRLWNEINYHLEPKAAAIESTVPESYHKKDRYRIPGGLHVGWSVPFVNGENSSNNEICSAIIDIYNRTGRAILDAIVPGNFKTLNNGQVVCVDIGMALRLQKEQDERGVENTSFASIFAWDSAFKEIYLPWFNEESKQSQNKNVIITTKALVVMQQLFPYYVNVDFLRDPQYEDLKTALANELDKPGSFHENQAATSALASIHPLGNVPVIPADPEYKIFLKTRLQSYTLSLPVEYKGQFSLPIIIQIYKNKTFTERTIHCADELLKELLETENREEALNAIQNALDDDRNKALLTQGNTRLACFLRECVHGLENMAKQYDYNKEEAQQAGGGAAAGNILPQATPSTHVLDNNTQISPVSPQTPVGHSPALTDEQPQRSAGSGADGGDMPPLSLKRARNECNALCGAYINHLKSSCASDLIKTKLSIVVSAKEMLNNPAFGPKEQLKNFFTKLNKNSEVLKKRRDGPLMTFLKNLAVVFFLNKLGFISTSLFPEGHEITDNKLFGTHGDRFFNEIRKSIPDDSNPQKAEDQPIKRP